MFPLIASTMANPSQKEEHLCHFHVRASLVSFEVLILAFVPRTNINISKETEKDTSLV
jgi:hypothetical protein